MHLLESLEIGHWMRIYVRPPGTGCSKKTRDLFRDESPFSRAACDTSEGFDGRGKCEPKEDNCKARGRMLMTQSGHCFRTGLAESMFCT